MAKGIGPVAMKEELEWRTEDDMKTLIRAKEIQADTKRMAAVKELAKKRLESMACVVSDAADKC